MNLLYELDKGLLLLINRQLTHAWLDVIFPTITDLHKSPWFFWIVVPLVLGALVWKYHKPGLMIFFCLLLAQGTTDLIGSQVFKKNVARARPGDGLKDYVVVRSPYGGYSFVSNHAANMFCFAKYVSEFLPQAKPYIFATAIIIGYSRIYNGVHYPSDVLGGAILGWFIAWIYVMIARNIFERLRRRASYESLSHRR